MTCKYNSSGCNFNGDNLNSHELGCPYKFVEENKKLTSSLGDSANTTTKNSFQQNLWDRFNEVSEKLKKGLKALSNFMGFLKSQASTLDSYGSTLSKQYLPIDFCG
jgi:hypothetical protein